MRIKRLWREANRRLGFAQDHPWWAFFSVCLANPFIHAGGFKNAYFLSPASAYTFARWAGTLPGCKVTLYGRWHPFTTYSQLKTWGSLSLKPNAAK